ncbi:MAG: aminopeptidase P family protein [Caldilineaceae bacterium]
MPSQLHHFQNLLKQTNIDAWIVPSADPHQSEYVAEHWQARAWLSGFSGSAGTLVVTPNWAGLWTDPRYHLRAAAELAGSGIALFRLGLPDVPSHLAWLASALPAGATVGLDASVLSAAAFAELSQRLQAKAVKFYTERNLVQECWQERPPMPQAPVFEHEEHFAGEARAAKLARIRARLHAEGAHAHLLTALDDIAWTFNLRGGDVAFNPVTIAYALILEDEARLYIDRAKVPASLQEALARDGVVLEEYTAIEACWQRLSPNATVLIDPAKTSHQLHQRLAQHCQTKWGTSIPHLLKATKNATELAGLRQACLRDGAALVRWLIWLEDAIGNAPHTEITVAAKLAEFRSLGEHYRGLSFGTICGYRANSAVGHYSAQPETTPAIYPAGILLIDSGAQYMDGTTDVTRALTLGAPTVDEKRVFTTVLKSHIRLATAIFPAGARGDQLDALAREPLWRAGWNCRHGIGHGVGHFLNVHEGPQRFATNNRVAFAPGMVTSNEPGVYFEGRFGVRLENLLVTIPHSTTEFGEFYGFETVTLCPFDVELVEPTMLEQAEKTWLNQYHQRVYNELAPHLSAYEQAWLRHKTQPV